MPHLFLNQNKAIMSSKKYFLLTLFALFAAFTTQAQDQTATGTNVYRGAGYDVTDSSLIPERRMEQQRDFLSSQYDFPSKPRNQWELGISVGPFNVSGDVRSKNLFSAKNPGQTLGFGVNLRKAWGYIISTRLQFIHGVASGFNWQPSQGYWGHGGNPWGSAGYSTGAPNDNQPVSAKNVFYNYKTNIDELSFQLVASLNNIKFHKAKNKASLYGLVGMGGMLYDTWVDAKNANGKNYDFQPIVDRNYANEMPKWLNGYRTRKAKNTDLKQLFDGKYESRAERHDNRPWFNEERTYRTILTVGFGIQFKLGRKVSLAIEDKWSYTNDDLIDGQRWQEWPQPGNGGSAMTRDFDTYNYLSLGLNLHLGNKSVEPLWWMNPLDYGYTNMRKAPVDNCNSDSDGDGVSDCFDRCPDTPAGVAVDTHGCPLDTDGDGVPDFKDKQLITPTECQPTDADGIGTCPDPECCDKVVVPHGCGDIHNGSVMFTPGSSKLTGAATGQLSQLAGAMRSNPECKVVVMGNGNGNKVEQQRSWDRVNSVINYMVDNQGIDRDRFIFQYGQDGNPNSVDYRSAGEGEEGPSNMPPPFPNLRRN